MRNQKSEDRTLKIGKRDGVALVVTLLMLSVITFMAIAFLAVSRRERASVAGSLNQVDAQAMADAALARAQADLAAYLMSHNPATNAARGRPNDMLNYGLMMTHNFINPIGFNNTGGAIVLTNLTNVSYTYANGAPLSPADQIQNIANLYYDPRPPVYIQTNTSAPNNYDFRYWLDYNRNGRFESNGLQAVLDANGVPIDLNGNPAANPPWFTNFVIGEPEYIGVLRQPDQPHGSGNTFIGRYAYLVLPIGKTLDLNYIHNYAKATAPNAKFPATMTTDGYLRNQGHGPWELNMAALLAGVNSNIWGTDPLGYGYGYAVTGGVPDSKNSSTGTAFADALTFLNYRYNGNNGNILRIKDVFPQNTGLFVNDRIDEYSDGPVDTVANAGIIPDGDNESARWPGSTNYNNFYDPQEIFDKLANIGSPPFPTNFNSRLTAALAQLDTTNRYTFGRLLDSIGTDSEAELYCWVHTDTGALEKRAKLNVNFDNSQQVQAFNKDPLHVKLSTPPVLTNWDPLNFFTNAAELLLRSQDFDLVTNSITATNLPPGTNVVHFGVTNILVYSSAHTNIHYSAAIHRMVQLAANIYDASGNRNSQDDEANGIYFPSVFRPIFDKQFEDPKSNTPNGRRAKNFGLTLPATNVYITNWVFVADANFVTNQFRSLRNPNDVAQIQPNDNIWGIPMVVGAKKYLPNFNRFTATTAFDITRKLKFMRASTSGVPDGYQMTLFSVSNLFAVEMWNPYQRIGYTRKNFPRATRLFMTNAGFVVFGNEQNQSPSKSTALYVNTVLTNIPANSWRGTSAENSTVVKSNSFQTFMTNIVTLPDSQWDEGKTNFQYYPTDQDWQWANGKNKYPTHDWSLSMTNYMFYYLQDADTGRILDVVNIGDIVNSEKIWAHLMNRSVPRFENVWNTNVVSGSSRDGLTAGALRQLEIVTNGISQVDYNPQPGAADLFRSFLQGADSPLMTMDCPYQPSATLLFKKSWEANDPLVHYTLEDLSPPNLTNEVVYQQPKFATTPLGRTEGFNKLNRSYKPWNNENDGEDTKANMTFKDPAIFQPEDWQFPTNRFPSIGWLGRVHRGSPWQTFYLKSEAPGGDDKHQEEYNLWAHSWSSSRTSYPTNDWRVLDLFTVAPTETAAHGLLSVNQTNVAPWSALLSGIYVLTNNSAGIVLQPSDVPPIVTGINNLRSRQDNGVFHHLGDFLGAAELTRSSALVPAISSAITADGDATLAINWDVVAERIPQQVLSLVKLGDARFVIYSFGQALKPANNSLVLGGTYRGMCTNYQITGEVVTRSVCHLTTDSTPANPKFVVDSFTILPGN